MNLSALASIATVVTIVITIGQLRQAQKQRLREFENLFLDRYWKLMDEIPAEVMLGIDADHMVKDDRLDVFAKYLRLCEDERE